MAALTIEFFHDVVCCWCYNISSRLRTLAHEFNLDVRHRTFVLQASRAEMEARWGQPDAARAAILGHWEACRRVSDRPEGINIEAMRRASFDYPHGLVAAKACKAAERIGGQAAHWDMFDRLQHAHLTKALNVADSATARLAACEMELDQAEFARLLDDPQTYRAVESDRQLARAFQVRVVPTLIVRQTGARLVNGPLEDLRAQLRAAIRLVA